jgi:hypothetical protein
MNIQKLIVDNKIPKTTIAEVAGVPLASVSRMLRNSQLVSPNSASRIETAVVDIVAVIEAFDACRPTFAASGLPLPKIDLRDGSGLKELIRLDKATKAGRRGELEAVANGWRSAQDLCKALQK